jgi:hypothetical protein
MFRKWFPSWFKVTSENSLANMYPELAPELHPTKNDGFNANNVSVEINSNHKEDHEFWWKCSVAEDHIYRSNIRLKVIDLIAGNQSCPMCKGEKIVESNSLEFNHPEIAKLWHPLKNGTLSPREIWFKDNHKQIYWRCDFSQNHSQKSTVLFKVSYPRCQDCSRCLAKMKPSIADIYDPKINNNISAKDILYQKTAYGNDDWKVIGNINKREFEWKCDKNHIWKSTIKKRLDNFEKNKNCSECERISNSLGVKFPEIVKNYWYEEKNSKGVWDWELKKNVPLTAFDVSSGSSKIVWWKCKKRGHIWEDEVRKVTGRKEPCPECLKESKSIGIKAPELAEQWHPTNNNNYRINGEKMTPYNTSSGYSEKVWWKCPKGDDHEWRATVVSRYSGGAGCPICSGSKTARSTSLASTNPLLAKEWHPTKNGKLTPWKVGEGSYEEVWWKCPTKGHVYKCSVIKRRQKFSCPICEGIRLTSQSNLKVLRPDLAKYWHPTKNNDLNPEDFLPNSTQMVWWKCPEAEDHEWQDTILKTAKRKKPFWCPMCNYVKVVESNSLGNNYPKLAGEWHPTKNGDLTPWNVSHGMSKKVWWRCNKGDDHEWQAPINRRSKGQSNCTICSGKKVTESNNISAINPKITRQWHPTKNGSLLPKDVYYKNYTEKIWWKCSVAKDHEWQATAKARNDNNKCPSCEGIKLSETNCLAVANPKLSDEFHPTKNGALTQYDIRTNDFTKEVWWKCDEGDDHVWQANVGKRNNGRGCPMCSGRILVKSNSLGAIYPDVAKEWHPTKNGDLTPFDIGKAVNTKVWWKCPKGDDHEWQASVSTRTVGGASCGVCSSSVIVRSNCLATLDPDVAKEWHPTKNGKLTPWKVSKGGTQKVWWKCSKNPSHEWEAIVASRTTTSKMGCPYCSLTPQSRQELVISFELSKLFKNINPKGYKTKLNGKLRAIDIFVPELNLAIEFDGSYWHKDKRTIDKIKSEMLMKEGYQVIRIREEPLKKIHENDIISSLPYNGKEVTNKILKRVLDLFNLSDSVQNRVQDYISRDGLQNEKALDKYIDQILEEKAVKRK